MPNKNAYLAKRAERETTIMMWGIQLAFDAMTLVLNDPEVMGKDVFGEKRFNRLCKAISAKGKEILPGLSRKVNASHVRRLVDDELRKICKSSFIPWEERYEDWDDRGI